MFRDHFLIYSGMKIRGTIFQHWTCLESSFDVLFASVCKRFYVCFCIDVGFAEMRFLMQNPLFFCVFLMTRLCDMASKIVVGGYQKCAENEGQIYEKSYKNKS